MVTDFADTLIVFLLQHSKIHPELSLGKDVKGFPHPLPLIWRFLSQVLRSGVNGSKRDGHKLLNPRDPDWSRCRLCKPCLDMEIVLLISQSRFLYIL